MIRDILRKDTSDPKNIDRRSAINAKVEMTSDDDDGGGRQPRVHVSAEPYQTPSPTTDDGFFDQSPSICYDDDGYETNSRKYFVEGCEKRKSQAKWDDNAKQRCLRPKQRTDEGKFAFVHVILVKASQQ